RDDIGKFASQALDDFNAGTVGQAQIYDREPKPFSAFSEEAETCLERANSFDLKVGKRFAQNTDHPLPGGWLVFNKQASARRFWSRNIVHRAESSLAAVDGTPGSGGRAESLSGSVIVITVPLSVSKWIVPPKSIMR